MIDKLIEDMRNCEEIEALVLGGSRATGTFDQSSDYDFYVYLNKPLDVEKRKNILDKYMSYMEYGNEFWELEDDGTLNNGIDIEFIYRTIEDIDSGLGNTLIKGYVSHGYTTCFIDNLLNSKIIFDKNRRVEELQNKYKNQLTDDFYKKIIDYNFPILLDKIPSLFYQIEKAKKREDTFSINHRSTAFFEMYFDILFAVNKKTHPGEKRLLEIASRLDLTPDNMVESIEEYFTCLFDKDDKCLTILEGIVLELDKLLKQEGYKYSLRSYK